jgi:hypothetical protein
MSAPGKRLGGKALEGNCRKSEHFTVTFYCHILLSHFTVTFKTAMSTSA